MARCSRPLEERCALCNARQLAQLELRDPETKNQEPHTCCCACGTIQDSIESEDVDLANLDPDIQKTFGTPH